MQRLQMMRYLIVEVAAETLGSFHSHAHGLAMPEIGIRGEQREHDDNSSKCHPNIIASMGSLRVNFRTELRGPRRHEYGSAITCMARTAPTDWG